MYLIKIFENIGDVRPKEIIEKFNRLSIQEDLTSFSSWILSINKIDWIKKNDIIQIIEVINNNDVVLFDWYIEDFEVWLNDLNITIKDFKNLFQNKKILSNKTFTNQTPKQIIDNLIWDYNLKWDNWNCISSITTTITKSYSIWDNYYDIINEICDFLQLQWIIKDNTIFVEEFIWEDKSSWVNFFEFIYNAIDITENNIISINRKSTPIFNIIIWIDKDWNKSIQEDLTSINNNWPLSNNINIRNGDLATITQSFLDFYKTEKVYYELESELLNQELNIGDKVAVRIEEAGEYLNFEWTAFIISKESDFINNSRFIKYNISTNNIKIKSFIQRMRKIDSELNFFAI